MYRIYDVREKEFVLADHLQVIIDYLGDGCEGLKLWKSTSVVI